MRTRSFVSLFAVITLLMLVTSSYAGEQPTAVYGHGASQFSLATGSPGELGPLKVLAEAFGKQDNARMAWFKAGSGESLKLLENKKVDMIMVHAPAAEKQAVQDGWATKRSLIGSNEFFIVGPANDPAKIAVLKADKLLVNTYQALCQPPGATPGSATAAKFIDFVASPQGHKIIQNYGKDKYGEGLYNDAAYAKHYDD